jgi:hypothetical protein
MKLKRRFLLWVIYLVFLSCLLPAAIYFYKKPAYNFDMLGYMALVVKIDKPNTIARIHEITYSSARQNIPPEEYKKLTENPPYRKTFESDPSEFSKVLPNYVVKPLYIWLCWLFYKSGSSLPMATAMPSMISYLLLGIFLFYWLGKYLQTVFAFAGAALIMYSVFMTAIARLSTPDCLSTLFLFVSLYFILEKKNLALMSLFFLLAAFTRVDNIITCFFIISFLTLSKKWKMINRKQYFFMVAVFAVAYITIVLPVRQFGWSVFFYSNYAKHIDYSRDFNEPVSILSYFSLVYSKLVTAFVSTHFTFFLFLGLLILVTKKFSLRTLSFDQTFLLVLAATGLFKFLLLPDLSDRFYLGFYLTIIMLLVRKFYPKLSIVGNEDR